MKKSHFVIVLVILCSVLVGCSKEVTTKGKESNKTYSDAKALVSVEDEFSESMETIKHTPVEFQGDIENLEGYMTLWKIEINEDSKLSIDYTIENELGKVKLILVKVNETVQIIGELTKSGKLENTKSFDLPKGEYAFKIVGNETKCSVKVILEAADSVKITVHDSLKELDNL